MTATLAPIPATPTREQSAALNARARRQLASYAKRQADTDAPKRELLRILGIANHETLDLEDAFDEVVSDAVVTEMRLMDTRETRDERASTMYFLTGDVRFLDAIDGAA